MPAFCVCDLAPPGRFSMDGTGIGLLRAMQPDYRPEMRKRTQKRARFGGCSGI